jgi:hypothetical protein
MMASAMFVSFAGGEGQFPVGGHRKRVSRGSATGS